MEKKSVYIKGSKIPITYFFTYIKNGYSLSDFLSAYPWIKKRDVINKMNEFEKHEVTAKYVF